MQNYLVYGLFSSSDIKTNAIMLKLLRFESGFCFRLQVKNKGGGMSGNKPNQLGPFE